MNETQLNNKDIKILSFLRTNSRTALSRIGKESGLSIMKIYDRIKMLEQAVIKRYVTLLDMEMLGYTRFALILRCKSLDKKLFKLRYINKVLRLSDDIYFVEAYFCTKRPKEMVKSEILSATSYEVMDEFEYKPVVEEKLLLIEDHYF